MNQNNSYLSRRHFSKLLGVSVLSGLSRYGHATAVQSELEQKFCLLEQKYRGRLGLSAMRGVEGFSPSGIQTINYRAHERFAFCSTFKVLVASAILKHHESEPTLLQENIKITADELVSWSPITGKYSGKSLSVKMLCAAALQQSDNTAANLLIKRLGGLKAINQWARSLGDWSFRLDRWETELNSAIPGDERDTTTPSAMAKDLYQLCIGEALSLPMRSQLNDWLLNNTTGNQRIRAAFPASWQIGDKTGTGAYGSTNDIAVIWPTSDQPIILAIYFTQNDVNSSACNEIIVDASKLISDHWRLL